MGHKVHPRGIRLGITADWRAKWYAKPKEYANLLNADLAARTYIESALKAAGVSSIHIERATHTTNKLSQSLVKVIVHVARPGVVIGKKGGSVERIKKQLEDIMQTSVYLSIQEVRKPELDVKLVAENIASQLVRRISYKRAVKRAVSTTMKMGALGVKINVSGRLGGTEIARSDSYQEGRMPLHEFRANIDRDTALAHTSSGIIGVTVLINKEIDKQKKFNTDIGVEDNFSKKDRSEKTSSVRRSRGGARKQSAAPVNS